MKRLCFLLGILFCIAACGSLPEIRHPESLMLPEGPPRCRRPFIEGRWQFQHTIEATFPEEQKSVLAGVSLVSAESGSIHFILMTIEGIVVFDARYDREIRIQRAIRPFDNERFARGLLNDLRLAFFRPEGALIETGTLPDGSYVCRYQQPHRGVMDIVRNSDHYWQVQQYGRWFTEKRTLDIFFSDNFRFDGFQAPSRLKLTAGGYSGYTLDMDLIEAVSLEERK
jgi:hypothetical protein